MTDKDPNEIETNETNPSSDEEREGEAPFDLRMPAMPASAPAEPDPSRRD